MSEDCGHSGYRGGFDGCEFGAFIAIIILLFVIFAGLCCGTR